MFNPSPLCGTNVSLTYSYTSYLNHRWYILGDGCGRLQVWHIDTVLRNLPKKTAHSAPSTFTSSFSASLSDSWQSPSLPCSIIDSLYPTGSCPYITCSLYLANFGRLICGQSNGQIAVVSAAQAATKLLLQNRKFSKTWPQHYFLHGHQGPVTCLLYPSDYSSAYDSNYLISGGADFSVRLWDLYKGKLIHTFAVHGGAVKSIVTCPPDINTRLQTCVCSIGEDRSVGILSTSQNKCLLLASCHTAPVVDVNWRLQEDFLLVMCADGRLYVWQIETGTLDRCVEGERASIIWETTPKNKQHSIASSTSPIQVRSLSMGPGQSLVHVLLFDPQLLITKLQKMERSEIKPSPPLSQSSHVRAFRTYLSARKFSMESPTPVVRATVSVTAGLEESHKYRNKVGEAVAKKQEEVIQPETPAMTINIARLLVSCIHAWNLDNILDSECEDVLGLVRPNRPVSFGLLSRARCLSLVLPGWGLKEDTPITTSDITPAMTSDTPMSPDNKQTVSHGSSSYDMSCDRSIEILNDLTSVATKLSLEDQVSHDGRINLDPVEVHPDPAEGDIHHELSYHVRWQLSRSLTTQHLLTIVSITNTLMNQSIGAHALATRSLSRRNRTSESTESDQSDDEDDDHTHKDNMIRAIWSKVAALHCVMLPERMANYFRPPHLPVLAARFMDRYQAIREAAQALLQAELRREGKDGRRRLVTMWAGKLQSTFTYSKSQDISVSDSISEGAGQPTPTQQQQMTALVILGMIGAEFNSVPKATPQGNKKGKKKRRDSSFMKQDSDEEQEALDPPIARQTAKTLQSVLLEKPVKKNSLYSSMRCSAAELIGRGFHVWENHIDVPLVVMGLLDLVVHHSLYGMTIEDKQSRKFKEVKFMKEMAKKALNLMVLLRPVTIIDVLAKEVTLYLGTHHSSPFPHSSLPQIQVAHHWSIKCVATPSPNPLPVGTTPPPNTPGIVTPSNSLLTNCKREVLGLIHTILDKCSSQISAHLIDVVNVVLFCLEPEDLKRKNFQELFPSLTRLSSVSYNLKTKRLAVGARSGQINIYDLKQRKTQTIIAHSHLVTVLSFSEDGKFLATYSYGDSLLQIWHIATSLLGGMISQTPKCIHSWPAISSSSPSSYSNYVRLEWANNKIIVLYMPGGIEYRYSM